MNLDLLSVDDITLLQEKITNANNIVLLCHTRPDGDAIGACLAMNAYLSGHFGKESAIVVPNAFRAERESFVLISIQRMSSECSTKLTSLSVSTSTCIRGLTTWVKC